jgi:hypothetical protein
VIEARWTPARPDCPHPEWWHSPDDESTEDEVSELVAALVRALQPEIVVETGTAFGYTAERIGAALLRNGHGQLWTLETDPERADASRRRCVGLPVIVVEKASLDWMPLGPIDFGWLDSAIDQRVAEFLRFPWTPGAIVGFHDTGPQHGYRDAVESLVAFGRVREIYLRTPRGVTFAEVLS